MCESQFSYLQAMQIHTFRVVCAHGQDISACVYQSARLGKKKLCHGDPRCCSSDDCSHRAIVQRMRRRLVNGNGGSLTPITGASANTLQILSVDLLNETMSKDRSMVCHAGNEFTTRCQVMVSNCSMPRGVVYKTSEKDS